MGRYESQRAIAARTISERRRGRKRPLRWGLWFLRRFAALALTAAAIVGGAWFGPLLRPGPPTTPVAETAPIEVLNPKLALTVKLADIILPNAPRDLAAISQAH